MQDFLKRKLATTTRTGRPHDLITTYLSHTLSPFCECFEKVFVFVIDLSLNVENQSIAPDKRMYLLKKKKIDYYYNE